MTYLFILGWILCGAVGFWLAQKHWRRKLDFTVRDAVFFGVWSISGPFLLGVSLMLWLITFVGQAIPDRTIWKRLK